MSGIIWGFVRKDKKDANKELGISMMNYMNQYKIDKFSNIVYKNIFMACGIQYITDESTREIIPFHDMESKIIITADAIIDNRKELLASFNMEGHATSDLTDSEYILLAYKKWGKECTKYLIGDYSFVIYDEKTDEVFCAKDHVGKRTFYYINNDKYFGFCTVANPLILLMDNNIELNERWLSDYIALIGVLQVSEEKESIIKNIFQLGFASTLTLKNNNIEINTYWNPVKDVKPLKLKNEEEYINKFLEVFKEAVNCRCRCKEEVAIKLSSGLDSSSVATLAAKELKKQGKVLKSFTVVPKEGYVSNHKDCYLTDESKLVKELVEYVTNIEDNYCPCENIDATTYINNLSEVLEQPYKFIENSFWMYELPKKAYEDNCRVLLTGQFGNATISFGSYLTMEKTFVKEGKILRAINEINALNKLNGYSRKSFGKDLIVSLLPKRYLKYRFYKNNKDINNFEYSPINKEMIKKWNIEKRFKEKQLIAEGYLTKDLKETRNNMLNPISLSQLSVTETKIGLALGVLDRDPTRDKRVIEFCLSLPSELFLKNGYSRYLIRKAMEGLLPDNIRMHIKSKGLQAADWILRLESNWNNTYEKIKLAVNDPMLDKYLDKNYLIENIKEIENINVDTNEYLLRMYFIVMIVFNFFNDNKLIKIK